MLSEVPQIGNPIDFQVVRIAGIALTALFAEYNTHARWLQARLNGYRLTALKQRPERAIGRKALRDKLYIIAVLSFLVVDALYALIKKFYP